jgi:hypothetical protein
MKIKNKIDKVVLQETSYIAVWTLILSAVMQAVFLIMGFVCISKGLQAIRERTS